MNKNELKKILKPLIKECIKEVLFEEEGALSHVIKEVAVGLAGKQQINETRVRPPKPRKSDQKLKQRKKKLLDAIGKEAYNGVNLFEGTDPAPSATPRGQAQGPLANVSSNDPGVDISNLFGAKAFALTKRMVGEE
jgi:hypothetical protein